MMGGGGGLSVRYSNTVLVCVQYLCCIINTRQERRKGKAMFAREEGLCTWGGGGGCEEANY
jgi:hypothetical protein